MSTQGLNSLATIIKRLEAATSRLEDIASAQASSSDTTSPASHRASAAPPAPPITQTLGSSRAVASSLDAAPDAVPVSVSAFDERIIKTKLKNFLNLTKELGYGPLVEQAEMVSNVFSVNRTIVLCAAACKKPGDAEMGRLLQPMLKDFDGISSIKDKNRSNREFGLHFQVVADGIGCVGWIQLPSAPGAFVKEQKEAAEYYANRVIKDYKDKNPKHVEWVRSFLGMIDELAKYVTEYHKTALVWNPKGGSVADFKLDGPSGNPSAAPLPPPPPPPPPGPPPPTAHTTPAGPAAVFAEINKGTDITKGLKKVDPSQMTHKNPSLRGNEAAPSGPAKTPPKPKKPAALQAKKPAKFELDGTKWLIEHQENERSLVLQQVERNQVVNVFGCKNSVIQVKGKVNAISMTNCQKTSLLVDSVISSISITNSGSFNLQVIGTAPTIQVDATDSGQIFLSKSCLGVEIITAKCSAINVSLPVEGEEEGIFTEKPIPEMFRTVVHKGKLVTNVVEHSG